MIEQLKNVMVHAGASWVLWLLAGVSVLSLAAMLDRLRVFWTQADDIPALVAELRRLLRKGEVEAARTRLAASPSAEAAVALAGIMEWGRGPVAMQEAMAAASGLQRARMEKRLLFLGTVGSNAPFVGLLGTVIGVVGAFHELGRTTAAGASTALAPERVMSTIAEALVATAVGLVVAIPAVTFFNYFQGLLTTRLANAETLGHVLLSHAAAGEGA
jgi:biopolymer transport protein ExbB